MCFQTGEFDWSEDLQGIVLSAFGYGYLVVMPFGGYIVNRFGAKIVLLLGLIGTAVLTILSPVASEVSPYLLVTLESIKGAFIVRYLHVSAIFTGFVFIFFLSLIKYVAKVNNRMTKFSNPNICPVLWIEYSEN